MSLLCNGKLSSRRFNKSLSDIISNIQNINDENELSEQLLDSLKILRTEYQDEDFYEAVDKILNNITNRKRRKENPILDRVLSSFNPSMIESQREDSNVFNIISENDSKQNILDETIEERIERESQKNSFLNKYFPLSSDARLSFEQRFKNNVIQNLFINKTGEIWTLNVSSSDMDKSIKCYQEDLLNNVEKYLKEFYPELLNAYNSNRTLGTKIEFLKKLFEQKILSPLSRIDLIKIPNLENSIQKNKLQGYISLVALINFDELISSTFGDAVSISYNKDYSADVLKNKQKYTLNLGNKSARTWKDDKKDIDETGEIGSIIQLYVESLNVWKGDNTTPQKITFGDIKTSFGETMNLLSNPRLALRSIDYDSLGEQKISDLKQIYGDSGFNNIKRTYDTVGKLLAKAKTNPVMFAPILFSVLDKNLKTYFTGKPQVQDIVHSIYKNIYDYSNNNSLLSIVLRSNSDNMTSDLFGFFSTLFVNIENTPFSEYKENINGGREVINITQNTSNKRLNNQVFSWEGVYNITVPQNFRTVDFEVLGGEFEKNNEGKYIPELVVGIKGTNFKLLLTGNSNGVQVQLKSSSSEIKDNALFTNYENIDLQNLTPELYNFLSEIFGFKVDDNFVSIYKSIRGEQSLKELFDIAGSILYNYKVGKTLNAKTYNDYQSHIGDFYNGTEVRMSRGSLQPELIPNSEYPKVLALSQTRDIQLGYTSENTAKDGENKQLSIRGLSQLMSKYMELSYNHNFNSNSIIKYNDFSIYQLFNGIEFVRDYNGLGSNQQAIKFSSNEFFSGSFIYDLYDGISQETEDGKFGEITPEHKKINETFIRIFGPTISDKNKLPKILIRPLDTVNVPGVGLKYIKDLNSDEIRKVQQLEFGNYYAKLHNNIIKEYNKINNVILEIVTPLIPIVASEEEKALQQIPTLNYNSDFQEFNNYIRQLNTIREQKGLTKVTAFSVLHNAVATLQRQALENGQPDYSVKMIDGVSYIKDKEGFLHNNPSLFHQLSIYGRPVKNFEIDSNLKFNKSQLLETPEQEKIRHKYQLLQEFFGNDITIKLDKAADKANAIAYKRNNDINYMQGSMVVLGKVMLGEENKQSIISRKDFENWNRYQKLVELFGENLPADLKISSPTFRLDKVLEIINNTRRLRSLTTKEAIEVLLNNKKLKNKLLKLIPNAQTAIESHLRKNNHTWYDDTVTRKAQEFIDSKSKEELSDYIAKLAINNIVEQSIINSKDDILISEMFNLVKDLDIIKERLSLQYSIELNPEIEKHNALNQWIGESYNLTSVGSFIAHPGNPNSSSIFNYEESQYGQQVKRQVSQTASKHREMQNSLYGIGEKLRFFVVEDERDSVITYGGLYKKGGTKPYDGATFYNMFMNILDNNSLGADAMGTTMKPFTHALDSQTGIGLIVKTAGFLINNQSIRESQYPGANGRDAIMNRRMNDTIKWTQVLKQNGIQDPYFNYLRKYDGSEIQINPWYIYNPDKKLWIKRSNLKIDENGITHWDEVIVKENGEELNDSRKQGEGTQIINSNYQLWKEIFGGEWSGHLQDGKLSYENDDSSTMNVLQIMNNAGIINNNSAFKNSQIKTQENVIQVLKQSMVNFVVTMGASKFGATNINSTEFYNEDYDATWMECNSSDFGEQLDAEHDSEGGHVSLMTQVVNALGARGYSREAAQECYDALEAVVLQSFEEGFDGLLYLQEGNSEPLKIFIYNLLKKSLDNVSIEDGNIMSALAQGLKKLDLSSLEDFEGNFAISDPRIFNMIQSKIASSIEKAVRLKMDGGQMVLNPSNRRKELIGERLSGRVSLKELTDMQKKSDNTPLSISQIKFGRCYYISDIRKNKLELVRVDSYPDFKKLRDAYKKGQRITEAFIDNSTKKAIGRDLGTYDCTLTTVDGHEYSLWQVDVIRQLQYINKNGIFEEPETLQEKLWNKWKSNETLTSLEEEILNDWLISLKVSYTTDNNGNLIPNRNVKLEKYLRYGLQKTLDALGNGTASTVQIDGQTIVVDKTKTKVTPYEAVLPMMYKTEFGLQEGDQVDEIVEDKFFFIKRDAQKISSKLLPHQFDLELKVGNGNHIYLHYANGRELPRGLTQVDIETITENGVLYRSENGKKLYPITENTKIFKSRNGTEIISTDNLTDFLDYFNYNNIQFGNVREEDLGVILSQINASTNNVSQGLIERIVNITKTRTKSHQEGLRSGSGDNSLKILVDKGLDQKLLQIQNAEELTIEDIINNDVLINEAKYSDLISKGQETYQEGVNALLSVINNNKLSNKQELIENLQEKYPFLKTIIQKGFNKHTSFLDSLECIVSRTPAQSHQSFMAMRIVGFDQGKANSIYVNRMQLFLQGSDYDIDKANVLGLKFHNGELITWSCFYDLSSKENADISEKFPFPTGRQVQVDSMTARAFDVNEKNYDTLIQNDDQIIVRDNKGNVLSAIRNQTDTQQYWTISGDVSYTTIRAILHKIPQGEYVYWQDPDGIKELGDNEALGIKGNINTKEYNFEEDFNDYINNLNFTEDGNYSLLGLVELIRTVNNLKYISPRFQEEINLVNKHNTFLNGRNKAYKRKYALYNFISIKSKNISKNPINLIQGQSGIDEATDDFKDAVAPGSEFDRLSALPTTSDANSIMARIRSLILTLSGKQNTGIVASAMKTFEAMSQYYYNVLALGSETQQKDLLANIRINGKTFQLLANSYIKNEDSIKNEEVKQALQSVDNLEDAFILMSALLSLSTDNAKDPTLSKYNADPGMIGTYIAGIIMGVDMDTLRDLMISDTGILLNNLQKGNVFNKDSKKFNRLSQAINFLLFPPNLGRQPEEIHNLLLKVFDLYKIPHSDKKKITQEDLQKALMSKRIRRRIRQLAGFLLHPDEKRISKTDEQLIKQSIKDIENDPAYWTWKEGSKKNLEFEKLLNLESLSKKQQKKLEKLKAEQQEYNQLKTLLEGYKDLASGKPNTTASEDLKEQKKLQEEISKDDSIKNLKDFIWDKKGSNLKTWLQNVFDWTDYRKIIENDVIAPDSKYSQDGEKHTRLYEIKKLNLVNEEMGELRKVLALNQGLPNLVQDQLNWVNGFRSILRNAVKRKGLEDDDESLAPLITLNQQLRKEGKIFFEDDLLIDLNQFLVNPEYQNAVVNAYKAAKQFVNIMDVMLNVPHYRGYLKAMNLLYEGSKVASIVYKEQTKLSEWILPKLNITESSKLDQFQKTANSVIFRKINNEFLRSQQEIFKLPIFSIIDGELKEEFDEEGNPKYTNIKLGDDKSNKIFAEWVVNYLYPYLKQHYPENAFVKAITLRTYKFNPDHNLSVNIAKSQSYNMKNPQENVTFNEIKQGLQELNSVKLKDGSSAGIVTALFYYNLIAYNGQPGVQALTDLFEDLVVNDQNAHISDYTNFLRERDKSDKPIFNDQDEDMLMRFLAPVVTGFENVSQYPYSYLLNPETNKYQLVKPLQEEKSSLEDENIPDDIQQDIINEQIANEIGYDDNEFNEGSSRRNITWNDLTKELKVTDVRMKPNITSNGSIIFRGYEVNFDIYELTQNSEDPIKTITENSESIILTIHGEQKTLKQFINDAKKLGWSTQECLDIFQFKHKKRSDGTKYYQLDLDILRHGLKSRNNQKQDC